MERTCACLATSLFSLCLLAKNFFSVDLVNIKCPLGLSRGIGRGHKFLNNYLSNYLSIYIYIYIFIYQEFLYSTSRNALIISNITIRYCLYCFNPYLFIKSINSQNLERAWKALREQADFFVWCRGVIHLPGLLIIKCISYDKYQSALNHTLPMPTGFFNKTTRALKAQFDATNGEIKKGTCFRLEEYYQV